MRALLDELRHNPDIVAVLVLSMALGIARHSVPWGAMWIDPPPGMRIHRVLRLTPPDASCPAASLPELPRQSRDW